MDFEDYPLKEIRVGAKVFSGFAFRSKDMNDEQGIPIVKIKNIHNREVTLGESQYFPEELMNEKIAYFFLQNKDVLIAMTGQGSVGRVGQLQLSDEKALLNQRVGKFIVDGKNLDRDYLYFVISSPQFEKILYDTGTGSGQPNLSPSQILSTEIPLPRIEIQRKISEVLRCLNDKIILDKKMNTTLEAICETVFKRWFVDFEFPNQEGKPYKSSNGEMVHSEELIKEVPKGWIIGKIEDVADVVGGGTPSTKEAKFFTDNGISWLTPKDLSGYNGKYIDRGAVDISEEGLRNSSARIMPKGTILFTSRAPIGYIAVALNDVTTNQGFKSLIPKKNMRTEYLYQYLLKITPYLQNISSGSTFGEVSGSTMKGTKIVIPEYSLIEKFEKFMNPINMRILTNSLSVRTLTAIRDSLLPKLLSGKIRVPVIKGKVES